MTNEEAILECQREIRRLRSIVRENAEEIRNMRSLLGNAVSYLRDHGKSDSELSEMLGISEEELDHIINEK